MLQNSNKETVLKEEQDENTLAIYLEEEPIYYIPSKDSGYTLDIEKSSCTNGVSVTFDYNTWTIKTNYSNYTYQNNERVKCSLYFKKRTFAEAVVDCGALNKDAGTCIKENYDLTDEVVDDETSDNNLRFIGADPDNYVWFNNELWRIIGVMNNIDDGTGNKETRLKIIRDESIGQYSWDNKASGIGSSLHSDGSNDWSDSVLQVVLNSGAYYNKTSGNCPHGQNGATTTCDFSTTGLTEEAKAMVSNAVWNLGGSSTHNDVTASMFYERERGTTVYNGRPTKWIGKIGLMYPSDYGYATSGGNTKDRNNCLDISLNDWEDDSNQDCSNNNWLFEENNQRWTITSYTDNSMYIFVITSYSGRTGFLPVYFNYMEVLPVIYLNSNIKIISGNGSSSNPFNLTII
ncbi:TPA: hypothetical protein IAB95_06820 [Candidatus Ventrenecus avicola]|nr:hypothetical protein [Candidatus Ventrenecus avicola]